MVSLLSLFGLPDLPGLNKLSELGNLSELSERIELVFAGIAMMMVMMMRWRTAAGRFRRTRWAELGRTVGFKRHENKRNSRSLTAAASDPSGLGAGRGILVSRNGNGIFLSVVAVAVTVTVAGSAGITGHAEYCRAAAGYSARKGSAAVSASYNYVEISLRKSAGSEVVLDSNGYSAHFVIGAAAAVVIVVIIIVAAAVIAVVIAAIAAHNIQSFRIANFAYGVNTVGTQKPCFILLRDKKYRQKPAQVIA